MKISYQFVTEKIEIDVDECWGKMLLDEDRREYNNDHKETRRHVTLDSRDDSGKWLADPADMVELIIQKDLSGLIREAVGQLHPPQRDLIYALYLSKHPCGQAEYAALHNIKTDSVKKSAMRARTALKKSIKIVLEKLST